jgi:murein hydrolase activator
MTGRALPLLLCLLLGASQAGWASEGAGALKRVKKELKSSQKNLRDTKKKIDQARKSLAGHKHQENSILDQLKDLDEDLGLAMRELHTHRHNLNVVQERLKTLRGLQERDRAFLRFHQDSLERRLVTLYKQGEMGALALLVSSQDPAELLSRTRFLKDMAAHNARLLKTTREEIDRVVTYETEYQAKEKEILQLKAQAEQSQNKVLKQKRRKKQLLASVRRQKASTSRTLEELKKSSQRLQDLLGQMERQARDLARRETSSGPGSFGAQGTNLWPVEGRLVTRFGRQKHPQLGTYIINKGIEIEAEEGAPFHAVARGRVLYAEYFTGLGELVIVDHGGGYYTLYGHASSLEVEKGQAVETGQKIGEVGDSGSFGDPTLYFEVRKNGKAIDPLRWLRRKSKRRS